MPSRLQQITFVFPRQPEGSTAVWPALKRLLRSLPQAEVKQDHIAFAPTNPSDALPHTRIEQSDVPHLQLKFSPALPIRRTIGGLSLGDGEPQHASEQAGTFPLAQLSIYELANRLEGHITRLDHTGVNLSPAMLERHEWDTLLQHCARSAALYRYPGEEWPFILPASESEVRTDITQFVTGREPKFEFVYADGLDQPLIQFSLDTDLSRDELETLFPIPEGQTLPGLEDIFRTVYVEHPWPGVIIRFDLTYRSDAPSDWETGEWLAVHGERIRYT